MVFHIGRFIVGAYHLIETVVSKNVPTFCLFFQEERTRLFHHWHDWSYIANLQLKKLIYSVERWKVRSFQWTIDQVKMHVCKIDQRSLLLWKSDQLLFWYIAVDQFLKHTLALDRFLKQALPLDRFSSRGIKTSKTKVSSKKKRKRDWYVFNWWQRGYVLESHSCYSILHYPYALARYNLSAEPLEKSCIAFSHK